MEYDGKTPLQPVLADLLGCSIKSQAKIAKATKEAKEYLKIDSISRTLTSEQRLAVYKYHYNKQYKQAEVLKSTGFYDYEELDGVPPFDTVKVAFYVTKDKERERVCIALDGYFVNALDTVGVKRKDLPKWVQSAVDGWSPFDAKLPVTRQVKYLIMCEILEDKKK